MGRACQTYRPRSICSAQGTKNPLPLGMGIVKQHDFQKIKQKTDLQLQEELSVRSNEELIEMNIKLLRVLSLYVLKNGE